MNTSSSRTTTLSFLAAVLWLFACGTAAALQPAGDLPAPPPDAAQLQPARHSRLDEYYLRPGASFSAYRRVLVRPIEVTFRKDWLSEHRNVDASQGERLRAAFARLAKEELSRQFARKGGYAAADAPGPDVLEIRASIVNLDIYAPEGKDAGIRRDYVLRAGEATLVAELRDSQTGQLLARTVDRREMREYPELQLANSVYNSDESRDLVGLWARVLRREVDAARTDKGS
jgi:uncharacterized protein DUF3313